jgi:four helix bundle protein
MDQDDMKQRTKQFFLNIIKFCKMLPNHFVAGRIGDQLLRAGTSVGAKYRAACRARSRKEFTSRLGIVEQETDETLFCVEILVESSIVPRDEVINLWKEGNEILSIIVATIKTSRSKALIQIK